jgi:hypothetical protein
MRTLTILLPDQVNELVVGEATRQNVDTAALCSGIIAEHFLERRAVPVVSSPERKAKPSEPTHRSDPIDIFDVKKDIKKLFPEYPTLSIELAEQFVGEALKVLGARAFKAFSGRGIGIEPNFVFVEYLQKSHPGGIGVSFYGRPQDHLHPNLLRPGRNPNYSRSIVCTHVALKPLLEEIRRSHELKFGRVRQQTL